MACCCGRISLPFGAALSIGVTSTTISSGFIRSPTSFIVMVSVSVSFATAFLSFSMPVFSFALTYTAPSSFGISVSRSALFLAIIKGMFFSLNIEISCFSQSPRGKVQSVTRTAQSVLFSICLVFFTRSSPSSPSSSKPGVSIITTGPRGKSSVAFVTGSVVVPFVSDTTARS